MKLTSLPSLWLRSTAVRVASRRIAAGACAALVFANAALATWSIVAINRKTGEVCVSSATCLASFDLQRFLPVVVVGKGGGAAQSSIDSQGTNRKIIWDGLMGGATPTQILQTLAMFDPSHQTRQYGIVDFNNTPVTFTGSAAGIAKFGVVGEIGDIKYAIQGNVLTGNQVILDAEAAFVGMNGDLLQKVIAGMEAARGLGGDGRCSCNPSQPTSCGVPPPNFVKSAHTAFLVFSRIGDTDGVCNSSVGCANGNYLLDLKVIQPANAPGDPVIAMQQLYSDWRISMRDRPDGILSIVEPGAQSLPADGHTSAPVTVRLYDIEGLAITHGGAQVTLTNVSGQPDVTTPSAVTDNGDGTYSFTLTAGSTAGQDQWRIRADDGIVGSVATLHPDLTMRVDPIADLHCGFDQVGAFSDVLVPFTFNLSPSLGNRHILLLASGSGTSPGMTFQGATLPLNPDKWLRVTVLQAGSSMLPNSNGQLDANGYLQAGFQTQRRMMVHLVGGRLDWSAIVFDGHHPIASGGAGFDIVP